MPAGSSALGHDAASLYFIYFRQDPYSLRSVASSWLSNEVEKTELARRFWGDSFRTLLHVQRIEHKESLKKNLAEAAVE